MAVQLSVLSEARGILRCAWILEIFCGDGTIAPPEHRTMCTTSWEKPEQGNADPDTNHM